MRFRCAVVHGLAVDTTLSVTVDADDKESAEDEAVRICRAAYPDHYIGEKLARPAAEHKPRRRDYSVQIKYQPAPTPQTRQYDWSNCESEQSARDAAKKQFLAEHPGAHILKIESRLTR